MPDPDVPETGEQARVRLASERTLLAWLRTGLALMGFGFVVARFGLFLRGPGPGIVPVTNGVGASLVLGVALVVFGIAVNLLAAAQHARFVGRLRRGEPLTPPRWPLGVVVAVVLAGLGVGLIAYLVLAHY